MLNSTAAQTLPRNSCLGTQPRTQSWSCLATARAAYHDAVLPHRQRSSRGARQLPGGVGDRLEQWVEAVVPGCDQLLQGRKRSALVKVARKVAGPAGRSLRQRIAIQSAACFPEARRLGSRHNHRSFSVVDCRQKIAGLKIAGQNRQNASGAGNFAKYEPTPPACQH